MFFLHLYLPCLVNEDEYKYGYSKNSHSQDGATLDVIIAAVL